MKYDIDTHILPLKGTKNTRDLGGYKTKDGGCTRTGLFFRSDDPSGLTPEDIDTLKALNVKLSVDLRSSMETELGPSSLSGCDFLDYEKVPLLDHVNSAVSITELPDSLLSIYLGLLDQSMDSFGRIFHLFASCEGASIFNCTAGKDRTGLTAMLLLSLAQVPEDIIAEDYAASEIFLEESIKGNEQLLSSKGITVPRTLLGSPKENMVKTLEYLNHTYGSAESYLISCGVAAREIYTLKERFICY